MRNLSHLDENYMPVNQAESLERRTSGSGNTYDPFAVYQNLMDNGIRTPGKYTASGKVETEEQKEDSKPVKAANRKSSVVNPWTAAASALQTQRVGTGNEEAAQEYKSSYLNKLLNFFR